MYRQIIQQVARAAHFPVARFGHDHFVLDWSMISELREVSYLDRWSMSRAREWFHVEMEDLSIFSFHESGVTRSYSYIECPLDVQSYRIYLEGQGLEYTTANRRENLEGYAMVLETAGLKKHITPIRYDLDPVGYRTGVHPLAHIHIGLENNIRIGLKKQMTPLAFVLFVMRQVYPECWSRLLEQKQGMNIERKIRLDCDAVAAEMWLEHDELELHLT